MSTYNLGRIGLNIRGAYDSAATYEKLDMVRYHGGSYVAKEQCTGVLPTNTDSWELLVGGEGSTQAGTTPQFLTAANSYQDISVTFPTPFASAPIVVVGFVATSTAGGHGKLCCTAHDITRTGFIVRVLNGDSSKRRPFVSWIAYGQAE